MASRKCVLVVDDEKAIRELIADALDFEGYAVLTAANGADALAKLPKTRPDVIVLDLMMPIMDGWTFLTRLRSEPAHAGIPVLVISASHDLASSAPRLGARACVAKPFDLDVLLAVIDRLMRAEGTPPRVGAAADSPGAFERL
jgi:two-component system chemotaxis response regulator CheY